MNQGIPNPDIKTLRDEFAMSVLPSLALAYYQDRGSTGANKDIKAMTTCAYIIADQMMESRK